MTVDPKRVLIRKNAQMLMLRYGFARTSMDDIARASNMSRPALYLVFKNKEEIYRDLVQSMTDECLTATELASHGSSNRTERLYAMVKAGCLDVLEMALATPHGAELLDLKSGLASDILADWRSRNIALLADAIGGKSADSDASILLDALEGLKSRSDNIAEISIGVRNIIDLITRHQS